MSAFTESDVEDAALTWLEALDWPVAHGPEIAPDMIGDRLHLGGWMGVCAEEVL